MSVQELTIEIVLDADAWHSVGGLERIVNDCAEAAAAAEPLLRGGEAALLLADDNALAALNLRYRDKPNATNVLSFPAAEMERPFLGDFAIAYGVCSREAEEAKIEPAHHLSHLIIHGLLHLVGYDHVDDNDAERMEALEAEILERLGIRNPYASLEAH